MTPLTRYLLISVGLFSIISSVAPLPAAMWFALGFAIGWIPVLAMLFLIR